MQPSDPRAPLSEREPARIVGAITAVVAAIITLLVAFGVDIGDEQRQAIMGAVAVLAPLVAAWWIRRRVWSPASVEGAKRESFDSGYDLARKELAGRRATMVAAES